MNLDSLQKFDKSILNCKIYRYTIIIKVNEKHYTCETTNKKVLDHECTKRPKIHMSIIV